jgi:hypothetical protein
MLPHCPEASPADKGDRDQQAPFDKGSAQETRRNARIVAEYLQEAGWERTIGAATTNGGDYGRPHRGRGSRDSHAEAGANAFKPFASWKSRTPTLDDLRERMAALQTS